MLQSRKSLSKRNSKVEVREISLLIFIEKENNKQKVQKMVVYGRSIGSIGAIYCTKFVQKKKFFFEIF
jgi:hypothetical protein